MKLLPAAVVVAALACCLLGIGMPMEASCGDPASGTQTKWQSYDEKEKERIIDANINAYNAYKIRKEEEIGRKIDAHIDAYNAYKKRKEEEIGRKIDAHIDAYNAYKKKNNEERKKLHELQELHDKGIRKTFHEAQRMRELMRELMSE